MQKNLVVPFLLLLSSSAHVLAHSGGTNADGCHTNRKTGEYHCHGGSRSAAPAPAPREAPSSPPAEAPVIRFATPEEISSTQKAPAFHQVPSRREPPIEKWDNLGTRKIAADGFEVIRPSSVQLVQMAQLLLRAQKYEITDRSGEMGYSTILAIRKFQSRYDPNPDGRVSPELLLKLAEAKQTGCSP